MITNKEIEEHQDFFEQCAKDYRILATKLIYQFSRRFDVEINPRYPRGSISPSQDSKYDWSGKMNNWRYFIHGHHCGFTHLKTGQNIEVQLTFGLEFGELDPYFFSRFIKSTKEYQPLPIAIQDDYNDGNKILEHMQKLGKFEIINSNFLGQTGYVVTDREKIAVPIYEDLTPIPPDQINFKVKTKQSFWDKIKKRIKRK